MLPGDPAQMMLGQNEDSEQLALVKQKYGFDKPVTTQYLYYLNDLSPISFHSKNADRLHFFKSRINIMLQHCFQLEIPQRF